MKGFEETWEVLTFSFSSLYETLYASKETGIFTRRSHSR
jgi:hypothetical protein